MLTENEASLQSDKLQTIGFKILLKLLIERYIFRSGESIERRGVRQEVFRESSLKRILLFVTEILVYRLAVNILFCNTFSYDMK